MNAPNGKNKLSRALISAFTRLFALALFLTGSSHGLAQSPPPSGRGTNYTLLNSWSFNDTNGWTSDVGTSPVSFTNVSGMPFGDGTALTVNSTNPAWVQYRLVETNDATNLTLAAGSICLWFAPGWSSADQGGTGPRVWGRLLEVGSYTSDGSGGWWSLLTDVGGTNLYFMVQPGDGSTTTYLQAPISWASNDWHCLTLTYGSTNTALYLDGILATTGLGLTSWPGTNVTAGGFFIGSDGAGTGLLQAQGSFDDLFTYNAPLDSTFIFYLYEDLYPDYYLSPDDAYFMGNIVSAPSNPSTNLVTPEVITGAGFLQANGAVSTHTFGTNAYQVWITNVTAAAVSNGTTAISFAIEGGTDGSRYDVFATGALGSPAPWYWMGQGGHFTNYSLAITSQNAFLILGTPQDSDGDGLTDAYELLISHTDPHHAYSNLDGVLDGWDILLGLNPQLNNVGTSSERANYGYTLADWLNTITGVPGKTGTIMTDNEGNVQTVSQ